MLLNFFIKSMAKTKNQLPPLTSDIKNAQQNLKDGKIILYPTDTVWGLGCDPRDETAVQKIFTIKKRPLNSPLILLVHDIEMLKHFVPDLHPRVESLLVIHHNPLTLIHKNTHHIPSHILHDNGSVAIRVCKHPYCYNLIRKYKYPIVSTSANIHGTSTPRNFNEIDKQIKETVDYVAQYGQSILEFNSASSLASYNEYGELDFIR